MEFIKKYKFILIGLLIVITCCLIFFLIKQYRIKKEIANNVLNFGIINNSNEEDKGKQFFLYSDQNYSYYLKDNNPDKIFILLSDKNSIEEEMFNIAKEMLKHNEMEFSINSNYLRLNKVRYCLYKLELTIDEFSEKMTVEKIPLNKVSFKTTNYKEDKNKSRTLYYTDKNGIKIYNENLENIEVNNIDLAKFLRDFDLPSDYIYNIFKEENSTVKNGVYLLTDSTKPTMLKATQYNNLRVSCYYENNEIFYVISYEKKMN